MVSLNDAILYAEKRIACLEKLPTNDELFKKIIDARTVLGLYLSQMGNLCKAKEAIDPIRESAAQKGYSRRLSQINTVIGGFEYVVEEDYPRALEHLTRALVLAEEVGDIVSMVLASYHSAQALAYDCQFREAFSHIEKALTINTTFNNLWGMAVMKGTQSLFQYFHGQVELSHRTGHEALVLAEQSGDIYSKIFAHTYHGISCYGRGAFRGAVENLSKGVVLGKSINQIAILCLARFTLSEVYLETGNYEAAKNHCRESCELMDSMRLLPSWTNVARMALEKAQALSGEKIADFARIRGYVRDNKMKLSEGWTRRYLGEILLIIDDQHFSGSPTLDRGGYRSGQAESNEVPSGQGLCRIC